MLVKTLVVVQVFLELITAGHQGMVSASSLEAVSPATGPETVGEVLSVLKEFVTWADALLLQIAGHQMHA